jgi:methionine aminopeptidase
LEPIAALGKGKIVNSNTFQDPWTIYTKDGSVTAHFEETVLVEATGGRVLTV